MTPLHLHFQFGILYVYNILFQFGIVNAFLELFFHFGKNTVFFVVFSYNIKLLCDRLTQLLEEHNLNQVEFAKILNTTAPTINKYCKGRVPGAEIVNEIANYFDVTVDYLYGRVDNPKNSIIYLPEDYEIEVKGTLTKIGKNKLEDVLKKLEEVGFDLDKLLK